MTYPAFIKNNLGSLADVLMGRPEASELDENGCFSKESCNEVEVLLLKFIEKEIKAFYMPDEVGYGTDPNNKWRTASSLQKAIRYGLVDHAQFTVSALFDMDKSYTMKRLAIIAVEDCLMGNPLYTAASLAILGHSAWRKTIDERRLLIWLAGKLAEGLKDRTAVNLCVWAGVEDLVPKDEWAKATDAQLIATMMNREFTYGQRMCAAWLLAGTKRFSGAGFPNTNDRRPTALFRTMAEIGVPRLLLYISAKTCSRLGDAMFATIPLVHELLDECTEDWIEENEIYPQKVGKLLGAAYDKHTREGKIAISRFFGSCKAMKPFMKAAPASAKDFLQGIGIFQAEGGVLGRRYVYGQHCDEVTNRARGPGRFKVLGDFAAEYVPTIRENLPELNEIRGNVLWAALQKK